MTVAPCASDSQRANAIRVFAMDAVDGGTVVGGTVVAVVGTGVVGTIGPDSDGFGRFGGT